MKIKVLGAALAVAIGLIGGSVGAQELPEGFSEEDFQEWLGDNWGTHYRDDEDPRLRAFNDTAVCIMRHDIHGIWMETRGEWRRLHQTGEQIFDYMFGITSVGAENDLDYENMVYENAALFEKLTGYTYTQELLERTLAGKLGEDWRWEDHIWQWINYASRLEAERILWQCVAKKGYSEPWLGRLFVAGGSKPYDWPGDEEPMIDHEGGGGVLPRYPFYINLEQQSQPLVDEP